MRHKFAWAWGALFGALLALTLMLTGPVALAQNVACFMQQGGAVWVAGDGCRWEVRTGGELEIQSGATLDVQSGATASFSGALDAGSWLRLTPQTTISLTMNGWLTPTGSLQPIQSAGAVSIDGGTRIATGGSGGLLVLYNIGAQTITISETTGLISAGSIALGAGDSATLVRVGTNWVQIGSSNN